MEKIKSYEQYAQVLAAFKEGRTRCATNKMMTRGELTALIEADKFLYAQAGDTLWFFSDEGYFYTGWFYVPKDRAIEMQPQDKDMVAELMGKGDRYNDQWDRELVAAGGIKQDKHVEVCCNIEDAIDEIKKQLERVRSVWSAQGFTCRKAVREDYPAIRRLLEKKIGKERYTIIALTPAQLKTMEEDGSGIVVCDREGNIRSVSIYFKRHSVAYSYIGATEQLGLNAWSNLERYVSAYEAGCVKELGWIRDDNVKSLAMSRHFRGKTGKFYWQFVFQLKNG